MSLWHSVGAPRELDPMTIWREVLLKYDVVAREQVIVAGVEAGNAHEYVYDRILSIYAKMSAWELGVPVDLVAETPHIDERCEQRLYYLLRHEAKEMLRRLQPSKLHRAKETSHSEDFTTVIWFGTRYTFKLGQQTAIVKLLWTEWEEGRDGLSQSTLADLVGSLAERFTIFHAFRGHPAYGRMIKASGRGIYRLVSPESA